MYVILFNSCSLVSSSPLPLFGSFEPMSVGQDYSLTQLLRTWLHNVRVYFSVPVHILFYFVANHLSSRYVLLSVRS